MSFENLENLAMISNSRKSSFIKYANEKFYTTNKNLVIAECFNKSIVREKSLITTNF